MLPDSLLPFRFATFLSGASMSVLSFACGLATNTVDPGEGTDCTDGELRFGQRLCAEESETSQAHYLERCEGATFVEIDECRDPVDCGDVPRAVDEAHCGDESYNRVVRDCRSEVLQEPTCLCGQENPWNENATAFQNIDTQEDADRLANTTFPWRMFFQFGGADVTGLEHILCTDTLMAGSLARLPALPNLVAVGELVLGAEDASGLPALRYSNFLEIRVDSENLHGLENLLEISEQFSVSGPNLTSLDGIESLQSVGSVYLNAPMLSDIAALSNLTAINGFLSTIDSPRLIDLTGLHNVRAITGDVEVWVDSEESLRALRSLEKVEGDIRLGGTPGLQCAALEFFGDKEVLGSLTYNNEEISETVCQ